MKPTFALKLSHDSVEILHRTPAGWIVTGSTRFDVADLNATLARLRSEAEKRDPDGFFTKLIMPDSEVRYATVLAPGPTDEARQHQIEAEIEGLTPYALNELAYDFVVEGEHALVAICAREILSEAEHFAQTHGFNPVSFVAIPQTGRFIGEPFFGETDGARAFLGPSTRVQRESEPVRLAGQPKPPVVMPAVAISAVGERPAQGRSATATKPAGQSGVPSAPVAVATRAAASVTAAAPEAFSRVGNLVRRMGTRIRREQAQAEPQPFSRSSATPPTASPSAGLDGGSKRSTDLSRAQTPERPRDEAPRDRTIPGQSQNGAPAARWQSLAPATAPTTNKSATPPAAARWTPDPGTPTRPAESSIPPASAKPVAVASQATGSLVGTSAPTAAPSPSPDQRPGTDISTKAAPVTFASRRSTAPSVTAPSLAASGPGPALDKAGPGGRLAVLPTGNEKAEPGRLNRLYRRSRRAIKGTLARVGLFNAPQRKGSKAADRGLRHGGSPKADTLPPIVAASRPPASEKQKASEAESLTIFGARNMQRPEPSFARRGLMLTGGLLLLLVAVAIWAVYFTTSPSRDSEVALLPQEEAAAMQGIVPPARIPEPDAAPAAQAPITSPEPAPLAPSDEIVRDDTAIAEEPAPTDIEAAASTPDAPAPDTTAAVTDPEALLEELVQQALDEDLPTEMLDQAAQEVPETASALPQSDADALSETAFSGTDTPQIAPESESVPAQRLGLPQQLEPLQASEVAPVSPPPPPPFGAEFNLGADGLVEATPEGALTPAGVMVFAGRPSAEVPPVRPASLAPTPPIPVAPEETEPPAPPAADAQPGAEQTEVIMDDTPRADPALANIRPEPRSPRVAAMAASQAAEPESEPQVTPQTDPGTAPAITDPDDDSSALAPPPGGVSIETLRPQRRPTDLVPPTETAAATATAVEPDAEEVAAEAVATSLRPSARPGDLSARIQEALAAARTPAPAAAPAPVAAPAPQTAAAAPNIPTSASVAQQATQARAINLRRINLIGIFGTPTDRRALVRLSNGQVIRVQVGDTLDGGRVSAIGDEELRYVKNGRNEVLRIGSSG